MKSRKKKERSRDKEIIEEKKEKKEKKENKSININHHWKKYFDAKYNQIFYNNPFTGESVWELPKGAKVEESNEPIEIITSNNKKEEKEEEESITEENIENKNSYKEIEAIEENELREKLRYRKLKENQLKEWLKRPARQQVEESKREIAYTEGHYDYNIIFVYILLVDVVVKELIANIIIMCQPLKNVKT